MVRRLSSVNYQLKTIWNGSCKEVGCKGIITQLTATMNKRFIITLGLSLGAAFSVHAQRGAPGLDLPKVDLPKVDLPKVEIPKPDFANKPDLDDARDGAKDARKGFDEQAQILREALKNVLSGLGKGATRDQIKDAVANFKEQHASQIEAQKEQAKELAKAKRDSASEQIKEKRAAADAAKLAKKEAEVGLKKALQAAETRAEKEALVDAFRADQKERHSDLKEKLKKLHDEVRGQKNDGDRRVDG